MALQVTAGKLMKGTVDRAYDFNLLRRCRVLAVGVLAAVNRPCPPHEMLSRIMLIISCALRTSGSLAVFVIGDQKNTMLPTIHLDSTFVVSCERGGVVLVAVAMNTA